MSKYKQGMVAQPDFRLNSKDISFMKTTYFMLYPSDIDKGVQANFHANQAWGDEEDLTFYVGQHHKNQNGWQIIANHEVEDHDVLVFKGTYSECLKHLYGIMK